MRNSKETFIYPAAQNEYLAKILAPQVSNNNSIRAVVAETGRHWLLRPVGIVTVMAMAVVVMPLLVLSFPSAPLPLTGLLLVRCFGVLL
jgi:hypothetical protein